MKIRTITQIMFVLIVLMSAVAFYDFFTLSRAIQKNNDSGEVIDSLNINIFQIMLMVSGKTLYNRCSDIDGNIFYGQNALIRAEISQLQKYINKGQKARLDSIIRSDEEIEKILRKIFTGKYVKHDQKLKDYHKRLLSSLYYISEGMYKNTLSLHREINQSQRKLMAVHLRNLKIILVLFFTIIMTGALILWKRILHPLFTLSSTLPAHVSGGSFHNIPVKNNDEFGDLIQSVNKTFTLLEKANKANKDFIVNINHELKTPLNGIIGLSHNLTEADITPQQKSCVLRIHESASALLNIVNDIILISKSDNSSVSLIEFPFNINNVVHDVINLFKTRADDKKLQLDVIIDKDLPEYLSGDSAKLKQILMVFVSNAVKFTWQGSVTVALERIKTENGKVYVDFSVSDTGIGINAVDMPGLLGSFGQLDSGRDRGYEGIGVGLPVASRLVRLMGGEIRAESKPGEGSRFSFLLPFKAETAVQEVRSCVVPDCIDTACGMEKINNNKALYNKLIRMFYQMESDCMQRLKEETVKDMPSAVRTVHSVKGAAANIGAIYLSKAAAELESSLRGGAVSKELMEKFGVELNMVLLSISYLLDGENTDAKTGDAAEDIRPEGYDGLILMVERNDADALETAEKLLALSSGAYRDKLAMALDKLNRFDFKQALDILKS